MLEKEYRFKDLPENLKQCLIHLHQKSEVIDVNPIKPHKIKNFEDVFLKIKSIPTAELKRNIIAISGYMQDLNKTPNCDEILDEVENRLEELNRKVDLYCQSMENPMFFEDLKNVYLMLSGRLLEIKTKRKLKVFN